MNNQNTELLIATPCAGGLLHQGYVTSLLTLGAVPFHIDVQFWGGDSLVTRARNILVAKFLESRAENLFFIDADISFKLEQTLTMLEWSRSNPGIVAGRYRAKHKAIDYVGVLYGEGQDRFRKAMFAGTGFMLIPRSVLERLIEIYPSRKYFSTHVPDRREASLFSSQ